VTRDRLGRRLSVASTQRCQDAAMIGVALAHASRLDVHRMRDVQRG
jgi:hypothetical protein